MSGQLRRMPADLTKFTARNGGVFPSEKVRRIIDGRDVMAHGDLQHACLGQRVQPAARVRCRHGCCRASKHWLRSSSRFRSAQTKSFELFFSVSRATTGFCRPWGFFPSVGRRHNPRP
jgi:hypothetical protein